MQTGIALRARPLILSLVVVEPKANLLAGFLGRKRAGRDQLQVAKQDILASG